MLKLHCGEKSETHFLSPLKYQEYRKKREDAFHTLRVAESSCQFCGLALFLRELKGLSGAGWALSECLLSE